MSPGDRVAEPVEVGSTSEAAGQQLRSAECRDGRAGIYPCKNVDMASFVPLPALGIGTGNDIWGWTDPKTDREYALMGTATTTGFVDVTHPKNPTLIGQLPTRGRPDFILWRDIKVDGHYAFIVSEISNSGLQVFDLRRLRGASGAPKIFTSDATYDKFSYAHNIAINRKTDFAYVVGSDTCENRDEAGGLHMVDISEPESPRFAGCSVVRDGDGNEETESNNYIHDVECVIYRGPDADYRGREICFGSNENVVAIYDVTRKRNPRVLSTTSYPTAAYTHQGSLTPDHKWFLFGDELDEQEDEVSNTATYVMRAGNLDDPPTPKTYLHRTKAIDHNLYTHGKRVYESNYEAGLRILEYDNRSLRAGDLDEVAFFDVLPGPELTEFAGTWSNYRFPRSGTVVVSTIENQVSGMFVLRPRLGGEGNDGGGGGDGRNDRPECRGVEATIAGDGRDNRLVGTPRRDVIVGRGGNDKIIGRGGKDRICGNRAGDELLGRRGADRVYGQNGPDVVKGNRGPDRLQGGPSRDFVRGGRGDDRVRGGSGRDDVRA